MVDDKAGCGVNHVIRIRVGTLLNLLTFLAAIVFIALHFSHIIRLSDLGLCVWAYNLGWSGQRLFGVPS